MTSGKLTAQETEAFDAALRETAMQRTDYWRACINIEDAPTRGAAYVVHMLQRLIDLGPENARIWEDGVSRANDRDRRQFQILNHSIWTLLPRVRFAAADLPELFAKWKRVSPDYIRIGLIRRIGGAVERAKLTDDPAFLDWLRDAIPFAPAHTIEDRAWLSKARDWLGENDMSPLAEGEPFSDAAMRLVASGQTLAREWTQLLTHAQRATGSAPTKAWLKQSAPLMQAIGEDGLTKALSELFIAAEKARTSRLELNRYVVIEEGSYLLTDRSQDILKGLAWMCASINTPDMARSLGRLALSAYKKVPGLGPRAVKVGNAAIWSLSQHTTDASLAQLAMLSIKVKFGTAQKMIEKALHAVAQKRGMRRDEIDELGVPSYGLESGGWREEMLGETRVRLSASGTSDVTLQFFRSDGKPVKSPPASLKRDFAAELKDLKSSAKDAQIMLGAQAARLDALMGDNRNWPVAQWLERYINHPLVGVLARRLVWTIDSGDATPARSILLHYDSWIDASGSVAPAPAPHERARLWHPVFASRDEVAAWRNLFESRQIKQPFKQAHREVYLLTDAERRTASYSNRFAAHVIRQHQFHALAQLRGWKDKLRLMVDDEVPATSRAIPWAGLRAEFWVEGIGDDYGTHTNETGVFNLLATDQVRFYRMEAAENRAHAGGGGFSMRTEPAPQHEPVPIDQVPALALSEVLRDVDLFVGVCSVGNNPDWQDGGPEGRYQQYWWNFSFGADLSETGRQRHDLLQRLIPRLAIRDVCTLTDRFLIVKGSLRTYKIHLGSGNILMEPNDQYLCIVPGRGGNETHGVFLPFDGDRVLSIILSKALLLADDDKISDASITSQIRAK